MKRCKVAISESGVMCWTPRKIDMECVKMGVEMLMFQLGVKPDEELVMKLLGEMKQMIEQNKQSFKTFKKGNKKWVEYPFQIKRKELSEYGFNLIDGHTGIDEGVLLICKTESLD